jgi:DNA-binding transcriptional MerR regulator
MKENQFYSIADCSRLLGVAEHRINYAHRNGKVPEPKLRVAGKRIYQAPDLKRLVQYFGAALTLANKEARCSIS